MSPTGANMTSRLSFVDFREYEKPSEEHKVKH